MELPSINTSGRVSVDGHETAANKLINDTNDLCTDA
jgi:hypothetical protein